jgi:azurin
MKLKVLAALFLVAVLGIMLRAADSAAPRVVKLRAGVDNQVKFDVASITASPGESIKVVLTNASTLPKSVMGHNWFLLAKGTDPLAFANAGTANADAGYVPEAMKDKILATIAVLGPGETGEVTFQAPSDPGAYNFVCTFPGHCQIGMKGTLTVK